MSHHCSEISKSDPKKIAVTWYVALHGTAHAASSRVQSKMACNVAYIVVFTGFRIGGRWSLTKTGAIYNHHKIS